MGNFPATIQQDCDYLKYRAVNEKKCAYFCIFKCEWIREDVDCHNCESFQDELEVCKRR